MAYKGRGYGDGVRVLAQLHHGIGRSIPHKILLAS
jgi:hypothetical protein